VTLRSIGDVKRTVIVVHSISFEVPDQLIPVFPALVDEDLTWDASSARRDARFVTALIAA
jgi:hypothetical protein